MNCNEGLLLTFVAKKQKLLERNFKLIMVICVWVGRLGLNIFSAAPLRHTCSTPKGMVSRTSLLRIKLKRCINNGCVLANDIYSLILFRISHLFRLTLRNGCIAGSVVSLFVCLAFGFFFLCLFFFWLTRFLAVYNQTKSNPIYTAPKTLRQ